LHNLGIAHLRIGNLEEAADAIEEAIKIRKQKLGSYSPRVADSLVELGNTLLAQHEHEDSIEIFEEALAIREKMLTTLDHSEQGQVKLQMSKILNDIGCANFEYAELDNAKEAFEEALAIQRACFEEGTFTSMPGFLAISNTVCNLALVHMEMADWESAVFRLEEGLKIQQNSLEHTNVIIVSTLKNLAYASVKFGAIDKALQVRLCYQRKVF
jgi:tetratricopeptide (TPR) repeat protein